MDIKYIMELGGELETVKANLRLICFSLIENEETANSVSVEDVVNIIENDCIKGLSKALSLIGEAYDNSVSA